MKQQSAAWEVVTPEKAEKWLNQNTNNRHMRPGVAEKYSNDMQAGNWTEDNPQPIIFYEDGSLADGQHRLWAIVDSGVSLRFLIVRGMPQAAALNLDTGASRTLVDNAKIAGWDRPMNKMIISVAMTVEGGARHEYRKRGKSNAERLAVIDRYEPHVLFACEHIPQKKIIGSALVAGGVARAHMHEKDFERLAHFCAVLVSGMPDDNHDSACIALRNYLFTKGQAAANADRRDTFLKVMNAIHYFMRGRQLSVIKGVKEEAYPLPLQEPVKRKPRKRAQAAAALNAPLP